MSPEKKNAAKQNPPVFRAVCKRGMGTPEPLVIGTWQRKGRTTPKVSGEEKTILEGEETVKRLLGRKLTPCGHSGWGMRILKHSAATPMKIH